VNRRVLLASFDTERVSQCLNHHLTATPQLSQYVFMEWSLIKSIIRLRGVYLVKHRSNFTRYLTRPEVIRTKDRFTLALRWSPKWHHHIQYNIGALENNTFCGKNGHKKNRPTKFIFSVQCGKQFLCAEHLTVDYTNRTAQWICGGYKMQILHLTDVKRRGIHTRNIHYISNKGRRFVSRFIVQSLRPWRTHIYGW
jgi:hypothetical protein